ncbi:MAG: FkbM family methyltransferase [Anaerocolumna jejuensis]
MVQEDLYESSIEEFKARIEAFGEIVIWGCGNNGNLMYKYLDDLGLTDKINNFIDNDKKKWGNKYNGKEIISPFEVIKKYKNNPRFIIVIASRYVVEIKTQLLESGIAEENIDVQGLFIAMNKLKQGDIHPYEEIFSHIEECEKVYSLLEDDISQKVYLSILNSKISMNNKYMKGIASPWFKQYFDDFITFTESETFCDCGSYNGDTLEQFIKLIPKYNKYIAFEADVNIFNELVDKLEKCKYDNVLAYNVACWSKKDDLNFQSEQRTGHISDSGNLSIPADSLDNILQGARVTFIKMDIEGAEEEALIGAKNLIATHHPILAICVYHKMKDIYRIPLLMKDLYPDYKFYMRHYMDMYTYETVCYAIPKERLCLE